MMMKSRFGVALGLCLFAAHAYSQKTINVPADQPTIQAGVNAANSGDTVLVAPGTYAENVTLSGKEITLTSSGGNAQTTIDGGAVGSAVSISNTTSLKTTVSGFSLINGRSGSSGSTAGVLLTNAGATVSNNSFAANAAALSVNFGSVAFLNNQVNTVIGGSVCTSGNGVRLSGDSVVLDGNGAQVGSTLIGNTIFASGKCAGGVGIIAQQGSDLSIAFNHISGQTLAINTFPTNGYTFISNNLINGNTNGGLYILHATDSPAADPADTLVVNNTFANNLSGAKGLTSGSVGPAEIYVNGTFSKVELLNNIVSTSSATNPALDCYGSPSSASNPVTPILLDHNLFYNPAGKLGLDGCPIAAGAFGNINANPLFVSTTDFHLTSASPAIDAGNNSPVAAVLGASDLGGNPRVQQVTSPLGPVVDMGAYEFPAAVGTGISTINLLSLTSSAYFLTSANTVTLSALLQSESSSNQTPAAPVANQLVTFVQNGVTVGTATTNSAGIATLPVTLATPGAYAFTANGTSAQGAPAVSPVIYVYVQSPLAVTTLTLLSSQNPSLVGQSVTFTVTSNSTDGTHPTPVVLSDNGTTLTTLTLPSSGTATYKTSTLVAGSHPLTAAFAGDSTHAAASATLTQVVGSYTTTTATLSSSLNPSIYTQSVTLTAHVSSASGVPGGSVSFDDGGALLASAVTVDGSGNASFTTSTLAVGSHSLTATFTATGTYAGSSGTLTQVVKPIPTQSILTVSQPSAVAGAAILLTATVAVLPPGGSTPATGTVTFYDGTTALGTSSLMAVGIATLSTTSLTPGTHALTCTYNGTSTLATSTCNTASVTITAGPTMLSLTSSANPSPALTPVTYTVRLTAGGQSAGAGNTVVATTGAGGSTGTVTLTTDATGTATFSASYAPGQYAVTASFAATTNLLASTASLNEVVTANATTTTLIAAPNPGVQNNPVTLVADVAAAAGMAAPTGTVTFVDGATSLGSITLGPLSATLSSASLTLSTLAPGTHTLAAIYAPASSSFLASRSADLSLTITPQDFTLSATPPSITIVTEHHASMQLTLASIGGFSAPIALSCGPALPSALTCTFDSSTRSLAPNASASITLKLDTDAVLGFKSSAEPSSASPFRSGVIAFAALLPLALAGLGRGRKMRRSLMLMALLMGVSASLTACGDKYPDHTPPGTYTVPIVATGQTAGTAAPTTHTLNITLTVTPE